MIRNYKAFGLALVAMLALGALAAQGVSAQPLTTEGLASGTVYTTGNQEGQYIFKSGGGEVKCSEVVFAGKGTVSEGKNSEQTVTPSYPTNTPSGANNCTAFGFAGTHVITNGCTFTLTTPTGGVTNEPTWNASSDIHMLCPAGKSIEITPTFFGASVCTQFIGPQTPTGGHIVGTNITDNEKMAITLNTTITGIHYIGTGGSCGENKTNTDGSLTGSSKVTCYSDEAHTKQIGCTFS